MISPGNVFTTERTENKKKKQLAVCYFLLHVDMPIEGLRFRQIFSLTRL